MALNIPSLVVSAVTTFDGKALGKGQKQISGFEKGVKSLGKAFGLTFGAAALGTYGKNAIKAFAENEKSAIRLTQVVKNLGLAFEVPQIERNLDDISKKYGYQGEVLREAFQKLIGVTASAAKSTELLNLSLSVSAGSGQDLLTVNQDLAAAYVGNTKGLRKYNLGLTQSELKTLKFEDAVALLTATFKGSAEAELNTYSGKMRVLGEAADNAQEIIGTGLVDALMILSGDSTVEELATSMSELATNTSEALTNLAEFGKGVRDIFGPIASSVEKFIKFTQPLADLIIEGDPTGFTGRPRPRARRMFEGGQDSVAEAKLAKLRADALAKETANQKRLRQEREKAARAEKNKVSLSKAAAAFDSTRISIAAALQATYDKETKLRLEALMLIEEDRGDEALKKISELAKLQKNADLQRLAGVETISNATLGALNTQLLNELKVINTSKMAEGDKELAREEAFKKYNAAITAAGSLAAKESYNERVQIQLTEIAKLAAISKTYNASATAALLLESSELGMIDRVSKAQAAADAKRFAALKDYMALLNGQSTNGIPAGSGSWNGWNTMPSFPEEPLDSSVTPFPRSTPGSFRRAEEQSNLTGPIQLTQMPTLTNPTASTYYDPLSSFNNRVDVTINAGIGDPEAIARAVEDVLNQSTYRGTTVNRGAGQYYV
jgi:hypothetical protein